MGAAADLLSSPAPALPSLGEPLPTRTELPVLRPSSFPRQRLLQRLAGTGYARLLTLTAPAGYGKTTLLGQWSEADRRPFAWLSLEADDNDPLCLVRDLGFSLLRLGPVDLGLFASLRGDANDLAPVVLPHLARVLHSWPEPVVMVLDDSHLVVSTGAADVLGTVLDHLPEGSLLVLAGRSQSALPLARLRAQGVLDELGSGDLAMTTAEGLELLGSASPDMPVARARSIVERCEGWAAALYLASMGFCSSGDEEISGAATAITSFIEEEILTRADPEDRYFLQRISILDRLSGPLCDAVLERGDSGTRLARLAELDLLVQPLDRRAESFRMHGLFSEALSSSLAHEHAEEMPILHRRTSAWFAAQSQWRPAITHAIAGNDPGAAADLLLKVAPGYISNGRSGELALLVDEFDPHDRLSHPELDAVLAWSKLRLGDGEGMLETIVCLEAATVPTLADGSEVSAMASVLRATVAADGVRRMDEHASLACDGLARDSAFLPLAIYLRGVAAHLMGDRELAVERLTEAERISSAGVPPVQALCLAQLALLDVEGDNWESAARSVRRARSVQRAHGLEEYPTQSAVIAMSALLAAHAHDGAVSRSEAALSRRAISRNRSLAPWMMAQADAALARAALMLGDPASAGALIAEADAFASHAGDAVLLQADIGDVRAVVQSSQPDSRGHACTPLTSAELRTLQYLNSHLMLREIAAQLCVSPNTVKTHVRAIYSKLDATSRSEAIEAAVRQGLLETRALGPPTTTTAERPGPEKKRTEA